MAWTEDLAMYGDDEGLDEAFATEGEPPIVDDLQGAARLARRIAKLAGDRAEIEATAQAEIARIRSWADDRCFGIDRASTWLERGLRAYMEASGMLTTSLPAGTARLRPPRPRIDIVDEDDFLAWAEFNRPDLLISRPSKRLIADSDLQPVLADEDDLASRYQFVTDDAEVVPGVQRVIGKAHTFTFNPTKESPDAPTDQPEE